VFDIPHATVYNHSYIARVAPMKGPLHSLAQGMILNAKEKEAERELSGLWSNIDPSEQKIL
jgi:hypothetical protein